MEDLSAGLPSDSEDDAERQRMIEFWNALRSCEEIGQTTWGQIEPFEQAVTECFQQRPFDMARARSLTARVHRLITGDDDGT